MTKTTSVAGALILALGLAAGCDESETVTVAPTGMPPVALTDAQIAGVLLAANQGEVMEAQAARPKLSASQATTFADRMIADHGPAIAREEALFAQQGLTAAPSDVMQMLQADAMANVQTLQSTPAGTFADLTYLCMQVRDHEKVLNIADTQLQTASNAALANEVSTVRQTVQAHLVLAQSAVQTLAGTGDLNAACANYGGATP